MSAHCNTCGTDLVYGSGENWQIMTCPVCTLRAENQRLREALRLLLGDFEWLLEQHPEHDGAYADARLNECRAIARAALAGEKP